MSVYLLDVNVLIALVWTAHESHEIAENWFVRHAHHGWATCPFTEAGVIRIISNRAFSRDAVTPLEALNLLTTDLDQRHHVFWPDLLSLDNAIAPFRDRLVGHRQITDAYLLGLAIHKRGTFATLDQGVTALLPQSPKDHKLLEIIR